VLLAAADKLSSDIIRKRFDHWTLILGPKVSAKERRQIKLSPTYAISQVEHCFNYIFKRNFPIHKLFERSCERRRQRSQFHAALHNRPILSRSKNPFGCAIIPGASRRSAHAVPLTPAHFLLAA
jgi:hypothetical protein